MTTKNIATVMLSGHWVKTGVWPRSNLRSVNQCESPASTVATNPSTMSATPKAIAPACIRCVSSFGELSRNERKKATMPKPKLAIVSVVRIQASVVRSSASDVRKLAMLVR